MDTLESVEGWFVSHLFLRIDRRIWGTFTSEEQDRFRQRFVTAVERYRDEPEVQINCYSIWGWKADLGIMMIDPDLQRLNERELNLATTLGRGVIQPAYSFVSMTEISEYVSQDKDYDRTLREKNGLSPDSPEYQQKMKRFKDRIQGYIEERLHPRVPDHRVMCFYPMNKKREPSENWYRLSFDDRKKLMASHAITGRKYQNSVKQLVTGAVGLDNWEWGVTLFSDDPFYLKKIVYEMRYDEASARYGEFGPFLIGLQFEPESLLRRLVL